MYQSVIKVSIYYKWSLLSDGIIILAMANGVNTEWFDLQVKFGNYLPKEKEKTLYEMQSETKQKLEEELKLENILDNKNMEQLKEMDDDLDFDDDFMRDYMAKRRAELT